MKIKLVSWNVNSVKARLDRLLAFLKGEAPDIVCLQELKCLEENFPLGPIQDAGYHASIAGQKTYNGVAILSREEPTEVRRSFGDNSSDTAARFIGATVQGVRIYSAYIPNGQSVGSEKYGYKLEWLKRLKAFLQRTHQTTEKIVIAGDFNVAPEDRDCHDPKLWEGQILFSEAEKAALREVCHFGLYDTFRKHHSEGSHYSWWDYRQLSFPKDKGMRIDFVLATKPLLEACNAATIIRAERKGPLPSDHAPVMAEFILPDSSQGLPI